MYRLAVPLVLSLSITGCLDPIAAGVGPTTYELDFRTQPLGWTAGFADYPAEDEALFELESAHAHLPDVLDPSQAALYSAGTNRSDDLFMFWKGRVTGLLPGVRYDVDFRIQFASNAPSECVGIGGAPGESVFVKAGATQFEPHAELQQSEGRTQWRMNIDKGNQAASGTDAVTVGNIAISDTDCADPTWEIKVVEAVDAVDVIADASGSAWLIVGTDSGFEGRTEIFWTNIAATFTPE